MPHVLIVEDDPRIRASLGRALADRGHGVSFAASGMDGLRFAVSEQADVVVLDLGLPDVDGLEVVRMLRGVSAVPIIVATARDDEDEIVRTLDAGADDYVVKPFSAAQIDARIRAVMRRTEDADPSPTLTVGGLQIDVAARTVHLDGQPVELTRKEFDLLLHLARHEGQVVSRRDLLAAVWRQPFGGADKTVDVHLSWLRRKLGESAAEPRYLHTVRGVGIRLVAPS